MGAMTIVESDQVFIYLNYVFTQHWKYILISIENRPPVELCQLCLPRAQIYNRFASYILMLMTGEENNQSPLNRNSNYLIQLPLKDRWV